MPTLTVDEWAELNRKGTFYPANTKDAGEQFQRNAAIAVARRAETVVAHEGWQTFLDHLGAMRDSLAKYAEECAQRAMQTNVWGDALSELKCQARAAKAGADAYDNAMKMIPSLISQGRVAMPVTPTVDTPEQNGA